MSPKKKKKVRFCLLNKRYNHPIILWDYESTFKSIFWAPCFISMGDGYIPTLKRDFRNSRVIIDMPLHQTGLFSSLAYHFSCYMEMDKPFKWVYGRKIKQNKRTQTGARVEGGEWPGCFADSTLQVSEARLNRLGLPTWGQKVHGACLQIAEGLTRRD